MTDESEGKKKLRSFTNLWAELYLSPIEISRIRIDLSEGRSLMGKLISLRICKTNIPSRMKSRRETNWCRKIEWNRKESKEAREMGRRWILWKIMQSRANNFELFCLRLKLMFAKGAQHPSSYTLCMPLWFAWGDIRENWLWVRKFMQKEEERVSVQASQ